MPRVSPFGLLTVLAAVSCAGSKSREPQVITVRDQSATPSEALRFMPLEDDTVYAYDTSSDSGERGVLMMQVSRPRKDRVDLRIGSRTERLQMDGEGISYVDGGFLLKVPLSRGAEWRSRSGSVRVVETEIPAHVPAGDFQSCIRTVEEIREAERAKVITSIYCPHVGLVSIDVVGDTDNGRGHELAVLRSFGPRVELTREHDKTTTTTISE